MFVLVTQSIRSTTRAICKSSSLIDHITPNVFLRNYEHSGINVSISDRRLVYCKRTTIKFKTGGILQQQQPLGSKLEVSCNRSIYVP